LAQPNRNATYGPEHHFDYRIFIGKIGVALVEGILFSLQMKVFMFFINGIFWLWVFIVPAGILAFVAYWLYLKSAGNIAYSIIIGVTGIVLGVVLAEYVRKRYGLDNFFGRLRATPDIDGRNILDDRLNTKNNGEAKTEK